MNIVKQAIAVLTATGLAATLWLPATPGAAAAIPVEVADRETVYTLLHADGAVKKTIVVDWLHLKGNGQATVTDFGQLSGITNLSGSEKPLVRDGQIIWQVDLNGERSIYYSGETNRPLPVEVSINYYLNGQKVDAAALAGKDGAVKIEITLKNRLRQKKTIPFTGHNGVKRSVEKELYTPLLSLVSINIPTERFTDLKTGDAMTVMTGKTINATWMVAPNPEETITLEMTGTDMELEPITITLIPKLPPVPEMPLKEKLETLADGVQQVAGALEQLAGGADQLAAGNRQVKSGLHQLSQGLGQLLQASQAQAALVDQSLATNRQLLALAQRIAAQKPQDAQLQALVQGLQGQEQMLSLLANGGQWQGQPFPALAQVQAGIKDSRAGVEKLASAAGQLEDGARRVAKGSQTLSGGAAEMRHGLITGLDKLYEEEAVLNQSKTAAEQYDTFLGKPQGARGEVRFILKTEPIKAEQGIKTEQTGTQAAQQPDSSQERNIHPENRASFLDKIIAFFSNLLETVVK